VFFQAGADAHVDDPLGGLLTTSQMRERDRIVFNVCRDLGIPVTWNLAGGYQQEADGSIPKVVELHLNTFEEALRAWKLLERDGAARSTAPSRPR
jgi:acetoin utilization deacetylase AcuC-like enzyme